MRRFSYKGLTHAMSAKYGNPIDHAVLLTSNKVLEIDHFSISSIKLFLFLIAGGWRNSSGLCSHSWTETNCRFYLFRLVGTVCNGSAPSGRRDPTACLRSTISVNGKLTKYNFMQCVYTFQSSFFTSIILVGVAVHLYNYHRHGDFDDSFLNNLFKLQPYR